MKTVQARHQRQRRGEREREVGEETLSLCPSAHHKPIVDWSPTTCTYRSDGIKGEPAEEVVGGQNPLVSLQLPSNPLLPGAGVEVGDDVHEEDDVGQDVEDEEHLDGADVKARAERDREDLRGPRTRTSMGQVGR